jgi:hypothetical protein
MQNDSSANYPRRLWQNQPTEPSPMTLKLIRRRVEDLHSKTRRQLLGSIVTPLMVLAFYGFDIKEFRGAFPALQVVFAVAFAWSLAGLYFLNRGLWSRAMPGDAALSTGIEFYRREIERRRTYFGRVLLWSFGPIVLALANFILFGAIVARGKIFPNGLPFLILVAFWFVGIFIMRMREQRDLQREINELKDIESQI